MEAECEGAELSACWAWSVELTVCYVHPHHPATEKKWYRMRSFLLVYGVFFFASALFSRLSRSRRFKLNQ